MDSIKSLLTRAFSYMSLQPEGTCEKKIDLGFMEICSTPGRESLFSSAPTASAELGSVVNGYDLSESSHFGAFK